MRLFLTGLVVLGLLSGCSSESTGTGEGPGPSPSGGGGSSGSARGGAATPGCKITLRGAQTGEHACVVSAGFDTAENMAAVSVLTSESTAPHGGGIVKVKGEPSPGAVSFGAAVDGGFTWKNDLTSMSTPTWASLKDAQDPSSNRGDFSMALTSVALRYTLEDGKVYEVHGTMKSTLPFLQDTGATGTIEVTVTF